MKIMRKITIVGVLLFVILFMLNENVQANEIIESRNIPVKMQPCSIITYIDETHFRIIQGGLIDNEEDYIGYNMPKPKAGTTVKYASDGLILKIDYPDNIVNPFDDVDADEYQIMPLYPIIDGYSFVRQWGSFPNYLYQETNGLGAYGRGRATTFSDSIGSYNNTLGKGDVALKMNHEKCPNGGTVYVTATNSSGSTVTINMTKADVGGMPDAIVDIWKTGVEYWGYTWNEWFSLPGTASIRYTAYGKIQ